MKKNWKDLLEFFGRWLILKGNTIIYKNKIYDDKCFTTIVCNDGKIETAAMCKHCGRPTQTTTRVCGNHPKKQRGY